VQKVIYEINVKWPPFQIAISTDFLFYVAWVNEDGISTNYVWRI